MIISELRIVCSEQLHIGHSSSGFEENRTTCELTATIIYRRCDVRCQLGTLMRFVLHEAQSVSSQWMGTIGPCHYFSLRGAI